MMDYGIFKETVAKRLPEFLPSDFAGCGVKITEVRKINEKKEALILQPPERTEGFTAPILYLDEMYKSFILDEDMDEILRDAADTVSTFADRRDRYAVSVDFASLTDRIVPNLIGKRFNRELLEDVPHKEILDMAVVYRIMIESSDGGFDSLVIDNAILKKMEITLEELHAKAKENLRKILPIECSRIKRTGKESLPEYPQIPDSIIIVHTSYNLYGAAYMLLEKEMKALARKLGTDKMYVIPASINYFAVCAARERYLDFLTEHLCEVNDDPEGAGEILSNSIYCYDVRKKEFSEAALSSATSSVLQ